MALRVSALERISRFDVALGPGTPSMAAVDIRVFTDLLYAGGGTVVYQPTAVIRYFQRGPVAGLRLQMFGYSVGLTAFYASLIADRPWCVPELIQILPVMYRDLFSSESLQSGGLPSGLPFELRRAKRRGMLIAPVSYFRARLDVARLARKSESCAPTG